MQTVLKTLLFAAILSVIPLCPPYTACSAAGQNNFVPEMRIMAKINLEGHYVEGTATCILPKDRDTLIRISGFDVEEVRLDGKKIRPGIFGEYIIIRSSGRAQDLFIKFRKIAGADGGHMTGDFISENGVMLAGQWCPTFTVPARYSLSVMLPGELTAVSESDTIKTERKGENRIFTFSFPYPREGISLVAGRYEVKTKKLDKVSIRTYFSRDDRDLAQKYLDRAAKYIKLYSNLLGPYPYRAFSIVENIAPTGYGFPSYTLLGAKVLRLPFIVDTSLGHEILHNWFGNGVFIDYSQGNWAEGLTTYLADQFYKEKKGKGPQFRHSSLVEYQSYVHPCNSMPLKDFRSGTNRATRAVGYSKGAMVFHMLRRLVTDKIFFDSLREMIVEYRFRPAGWTDIEKIFEKKSGRDLSWFFNQWLNRADCPDLALTGDPVAQSVQGGETEVRFTITQKQDDPYRLLVPVRIKTEGGNVNKTVSLDCRKKTFLIQVSDTPSFVTIDPDFDIMRTLTKKEFPPSLSRLYGAEHKFYIMDPGAGDIYAPFSNILKHWGLKPLPSSIPRQDALKEGSVLILGNPWGKPANSSPATSKGVFIRAEENPLSPGQVVVYLHASSWKELEPLRYKLRHYGGYSRLEFQGGILKNKEKAHFSMGIKKMVLPEVTGIATSRLSTLDQIIRDVASNRVIFIGEQHNRYSNHLVQLSTIKTLKKMGMRIAVGMEMFQRPYQKVIDKYLAGKIDERTFLRQTEYFKRWGYDYHLYRPIIQYCKKAQIPIIALNLPSEISKQVAKKGLDSLNKDQKKQIPRDLDLSNKDYKAWLKSIFMQHPRHDIPSFKYFFQAQVLWDETMAQSICNYLAKHPDYSMVVMAGAGHIAYGYGIPSRVKRRGDYSCSLILCPAGEVVDRTVSDYVLFPQDIPAPFSAKLGVILGKEKGKVKVKAVFPGTCAKRAGIRRGDVILEMDGRPIHSISDVKLSLVFKKEGDTVMVKLFRVRRFAPDKTIELKVGPFEPMENDPARWMIHRR